MFRDIVIIESLTKRNDIKEYYLTHQDRRNYNSDDLNFIHPESARINKFILNLIEKPFKVAGLGYGTSNVSKETEKCILRLRNHFEVIKLYSFRISDVDIILGFPWIEKHCPINYHDSRKIAFSSGFCARHCNVGKRNRKNNKKKLSKVSIKSKEPINEPKNDMNENYNNKYKYSFDDESDSNCTEEITIGGRRTRVKTCESSENKGENNNFIINYNSNSNNSSMFDKDDEIYEFSDRKNINLDKLYTICNLINSCNNVDNKCNIKLNKDDDVTNYIKTKSVLKNLCNICKCLYISNIE